MKNKSTVPALGTRKKISPNPLIQKNLKFLQTYNKLFKNYRQTGGGGGDAESQFKKSLRNYSSNFDLVQDLRLDRKARKQRSKFTQHSCEDNQVLTNYKKEDFTQKTVEETVDSDSSEDRDFFSPLKSLSEQDNIDGALETLYKMAEEFAGEDLDEAVNEDEPQIPDDAAEGEQEEEEEEEEAVEDEDLKEVEEMIRQASEELQKVEEAAAAGDDEQQPPPEEETGSVFKYDAAIDSAIIRELEEAEKEAKATAEKIRELKNRVGELLQKDTMTEVEARELEEKNNALKAQMKLFENRTKRIQSLLGQANLFEKLQPIQPPLQQKHREDGLPKMLVCGANDSYMPKLVLCQNKRCPNIAQKLNESYNMQERLVNENVNLEGNRYQLQTDLISKDQTVDCLQRQVCSLQNEMRVMHQENQKLRSCPNPSCPKNSRTTSPTRTMTGCGPGRGICPSDIEGRFQEYSNTTNQLEKQLVDVEEEVKNIQQELLEVQKEREHLEHHRKMLAFKPPCAYPCGPPCGHPPCKPPPCSIPCEPIGDDQLVKEIKEKYARLQEDFKAKLTEVAGLRAENEKLRELTEKAEESRSKLELKVKELEKKLKDLKGDGDKVGSKEQLIDLQQQLKVHKELYRQAQDELEELRALVEDLQGQLNDYRNKYLEAIQLVEEQKRQIEMMRLENGRISEQVNLEIVRVKNQFQEKLQELAPLPDILKATQVKLQEAQQMHLLAERNNEAMAKELQTYKDKLQEIMDELALADGDKAGQAGEKETLKARIQQLEEELERSKEENDEQRIELDQLRELSDENERIANEKLHEIAQLETQLENVRDESARQVSRIKDRCEIVRKSAQNQINDLERQLALTKASVKAAEKDRDDIRQKMQAQTRNLSENFEDAQMRIRNLQGHINYLKNSYGPPETTPNNVTSTKGGDPCCCAADY